MSDTNELDVIVVGAGLSGLACAHELAGSGLQVAVLERGDSAGSKNLSGGRLYLEPVQEFCGDLLKGAPFERPVVSESIVLTDKNSSVTLRLDNGEKKAIRNSATVLMNPLIKYMAEKVSEKGVMILTRQKVDSLVIENNRVRGVKIGSQDLMATVTVAADGVLSFLAQEAGLRPEHKPDSYGIGVKEIIKLDGSVIEDRFNLDKGTGACRMFLGNITAGLPGGGFIYTNKDGLSIGIVVHMKSVQKWNSQTEVWELLEAFKSRDDIYPLLSGGETIEYGAHLIPESGYKGLPQLGIPGLLLVGDAAGFVLNTGNILRGMDLALVSGTLAGRCIVEALKSDLGPEACLHQYSKSIQRSFILDQMKTYKKAADLLSKEDLYNRYPHQIVQVVNEMFQVNSRGQSQPLGNLFRKMIFRVLGWKGIRDIWRILRMGK